MLTERVTARKVAGGSLLLVLIVFLTISGAAAGDPARSSLPGGHGAAARFAVPTVAIHALRADIGWHGGIVVTSTGEQLKVYVSDSLAPEQASPQQWGDFFSRLVHASEFPLVTVWIATLGEIQELCGTNADGCYFPSRQDLYMPGDVVESALIATHEYGHHVARNRLNPPWLAGYYGPKRWASEENICGRAVNGTVFPGDEDTYYMLNPGEGFAEVYRALNAVKNGVAFSWPVVDWSFLPDKAALAAAEADVVQPWAPTVTTFRRSLGAKSRPWTLSVKTSLDGVIEVNVTVSRALPFELSLLSADRKAPLARGVWVGPKERQLRYTVCGGKRSFVVRVATRNPLGLVSARSTRP